MIQTVFTDFNSLRVLKTTAQRQPCLRSGHRRSGVIMNAGFGQAGSKAGKKQPRIARFLDEDGLRTNFSEPSTSGSSDGWFEVPDVNAETSFLSKPIKAVILATGRAICLYKVQDEIFCTDANSTAFKYPLADANLLKLNSGPAVETKLDGTVYDLRTGKVVSWCPKNNPIRAVLGSLKDKSVPEDLAVHSVRLESDGRVKVRLSM